MLQRAVNACDARRRSQEQLCLLCVETCQEGEPSIFFYIFFFFFFSFLTSCMRMIAEDEVGMDRNTHPRPGPEARTGAWITAWGS